MARLTESQIAQFWSLVERGDGDSCWAWTGGSSTQMHYGSMSVNGSSEYAHRLSWEIATGFHPGSQCVLHKCDNPKCIRPSHLFLGSRQDNIADKVAKGRQPHGSRVGGAKLSDEIVSRILTAFSTKDTGALELSREYGVQESTLRSILRGETWIHVPGPRLSAAEIVAIGKLNRVKARRLKRLGRLIDIQPPLSTATSAANDAIMQPLLARHA